MAGLYLHVPFCKQACYYCDFHFSTQQDTKQVMVDALCQELVLQKNYLENEPVETIYFGGGTPSLLSAKQLQSILHSIHKNYLTNLGEVTLEANPDDLTKEKLISLKESGINRLSIGIQSFDDGILKFLNRAHTSKDAVSCIELSRQVGFNNLSLDLIYSIPGQDHHQWKSNIERAIALNPEHISAYTLTIEEKTIFGNWRNKGKLIAETDDFAADQMEILIDTLGNAGYEHYEISNFCKPGFFSKHNSSYWQQKRYLGIGPSAHSFNGSTRQFNLANNALYEQAVSKGEVPFEQEILSQSNKINEYLLTSLRTAWGCDLNYLLAELGYDLLKEKANRLEQFLGRDFLQKKENILRLTKKGKMLADKIAMDLFVED